MNEGYRMFSIISAELIFFQHTSTPRLYWRLCLYFFQPILNSMQSKKKYMLDIDIIVVVFWLSSTERGRWHGPRANSAKVWSSCYGWPWIQGWLLFLSPGGGWWVWGPEHEVPVGAGTNARSVVNSVQCAHGIVVGVGVYVPATLVGGCTYMPDSVGSVANAGLGGLNVYCSTCHLFWWWWCLVVMVVVVVVVVAAAAAVCGGCGGVCGVVYAYACFEGCLHQFCL